MGNMNTMKNMMRAILKPINFQKLGLEINFYH